MDVWLFFILGGVLAWPLWRGLRHNRLMQQMLTPGPRCLRRYVPAPPLAAQAENESKEGFRA